MPVSAVSQSFAAYAQKVVSGNAPKPNSPAGMAQEAQETQATTVKEAHNGDPIARKRLLKEQEAKQQQQSSAAPAKSSEPGKGEAIDHKA